MTEKSVPSTMTYGQDATASWNRQYPMCGQHE